MGVLRELESALGGIAEHEAWGRPVAPALRIRIIRRALPMHELEMELEAEPFDPSPPPRDAVLLTRFGFSSAALTSGHVAIINRLAQTIVSQLPRHPLMCLTVQIEGHEDEVGDPAGFGRFGQQRAEAVTRVLAARVQALVSRMPAASRPTGQLIIEISSAGPTRPIRSNVTEDGRAQNRRVEVTVRPPAVCPDAA